MTNPPNTEGLSAEQIELLRSLPLKAERVSPEVLAEVKQNLTPFATWGTAFDRDKAWLTEVGERLLATIDTERERTLAEIDAAAERFAAKNGSPLGAFVYLNYGRADETLHDEIVSDDALRIIGREFRRERLKKQRGRGLTAALLAPQESNQEGAG